MMRGAFAISPELGGQLKTLIDNGVRAINAKLRTALLAQGAECVVCGHRGYLEIDHHHGVGEGGPTCLHNLGPLCWICHHRKTNGWKLGPRDPVTGRRTLTPPAARDGPKG